MLNIVSFNTHTPRFLQNKIEIITIKLKTDTSGDEERIPEEN